MLDFIWSQAPNLPVVAANCAIASALVCIAGILISRSGRSAGPRFQHNILLTVLLVTLAVPPLQWWLSSVSIGLVPIASDSAGNAGSSVIWWVLGCWSVIAFGLLGRLAVGYFWIVATRRQLTGTASPRMQRLLHAATDHVGLRKLPGLCETEHSVGPVVIGIRKPMIVLPRSLCESMSDRQLMCVLVHECEHIRRRDTLIVTLQEFACCVYWWNPLVYWAGRQLEACRERACDDQVGLLQQARGSYPSALLAVAQWSSSQRLARGPHLALLSGKHDLIDRIRRYRQRDAENEPGPSGKLRGVLVVCLVSGLATAMVPLGRRNHSELSSASSLASSAAPAGPLVYCRIQPSNSPEAAVTQSLDGAIQRFHRDRCRGMIVDMRSGQSAETTQRIEDALVDSPSGLPEVVSQSFAMNQPTDTRRGDSEIEATQSTLAVVLVDQYDDTSDDVVRRIEQEDIRAVILSTPKSQESDKPLEFSAATESTHPEPDDMQLQLAINMLSHV